MGFSNAFVAAACLLTLFSRSVEGGRIRRVRAGARYKDHDEVHIVVNKVG
jgi:hypothetical protein